MIVSDEHIVIGPEGIWIGLHDVERIDVVGPEVGVQVVETSSRVWQVALPDVAYGQAAAFVALAQQVKAELPEVRTLYAEREEAALKKIRRAEADQAECEACVRALKAELSA